MFNIFRRRYLFFALSALVIMPGLLGLFLWGLPLAIDFPGGNLREIRFEAGMPPPPADVVAFLEARGVGDPIAQSAGTSDLIIRSRPIEESIRLTLLADLQAQFGGPLTVLRDERVGPSIGAEVAQRAAGAVGLAVVGILAYITYAFRGVTHALRYGVAAIVAMLHDVAVVVSIESLLGHFLGWEVDSLFLPALLTVIGFSVHDTIVVFDRIRETRSIQRRLPFDTIVNQSINH